MTVGVLGKGPVRVSGVQGWGNGARSGIREGVGLWVTLWKGTPPLETPSPLLSRGLFGLCSCAERSVSVGVAGEPGRWDGEGAGAGGRRVERPVVRSIMWAGGFRAGLPGPPWSPHREG